MYQNAQALKDVQPHYLSTIDQTSSPGPTPQKSNAKQVRTEMLGRQKVFILARLLHSSQWHDIYVGGMSHKDIDELGPKNSPSTPHLDQMATSIHIRADHVGI
jgi:hypothetical protein